MVSRDLTLELPIPYSDGLLDCSYPSGLAWELVSLGESCEVLRSWLHVPYTGGGPSSYVMLLIGLVRRTGYMYANIGFLL